VDYSEDIYVGSRLDTSKKLGSPGDPSEVVLPNRTGEVVNASPGSLRRERDPERLLKAAMSGDRVALARLVSFVEQGGSAARSVGRLVYPRAGSAYSIGITGAPGAGKSTLTDQLITRVRNEDGGQVGVLAVDPSSPFSGGAILGDRIRMSDHALDDGVFIRSMATRGHLGGLSLAVPEVMRLLDAVGIPYILVETVGVGQVEVEVAAATDSTVVVVNPGWGDAIQANKAGLMEIADIFVINKADRPSLSETRRDLEMMIDLSSREDQEVPWRPPILATVATSGEGVDELWNAILEHRRFLEDSGLLERKRLERMRKEFRRILVRRIEERVEGFLAREEVDSMYGSLLKGEIDPYEAVELLLSRLSD